MGFVKVFRDLLWFFKQEKKSYIIGVSLLVMVSLLQIIPPKVIGIVIDEINTGTISKKSLTEWCGLLIGTAVALYGLRYVWRLLIFGSARKLAKQLRNDLYTHFSKMSPAFYHRRRVGDLMAHATNDLDAVQQTAGEGILTLVDSMTMGSVIIITMATTISWKLTIIALLPMPLIAVSTSYYGSLLHRYFHKAQESFSGLNDKVQESVNGIKVIKTFGYEQDDIESFRKKSEEVVAKNMNVAKVDALFDPTISIIITTSFFLSIYYGSKMVINETLTIGQLVTFTSYLGTLGWPMLAFGFLFNIMERGRASYDRVRTLLAEPEDIVEKLWAIESAPLGNLEFSLDEFTYPNEEMPMLKQIHFQLNSGETLGVVGKTGSGKTTLLKLIMREFDGYNGEITFGKHEISEYSLQALRSAIGYVPQDHFLFSATIAENIAFAEANSSKEKIEASATLANVHQDIMSFTDGYETIVGERGVSLSGGQKQRISIARALLLNPTLLILDDSLSAVDAKTEEAILNNLRENRQGKTTIITSHRLSALQHANLIIVLEEGKIVERGTHEQLMQGGWYKEMYERQQLETLVERGGGL